MQTDSNRLARNNQRIRAHASRSRSRGRRRRWAALLAAAALLASAVPSKAATGGASLAYGALPSAQDIAFSPLRAAGATWYGPGFYGHHTACGQVLRPNVIGVAHRSLPCGTVVKLAYQGRSILTTVIDRGPYAQGYTWDLTNGARLALGLEGSDQIRYALPLSFARR